MKRVAAIVPALFAVAFSLASMSPSAAPAADALADRIVVMYFHRTKRCPTCLKMGSYSEEAVQSGFAEQLKDGAVAFHYIDFQDKKNEKLAKGYRIEGPALIVAKITSNKVAKFTDLEDIWAKVGDRPAFLKYVRDSVAAHRK